VSVSSADRLIASPDVLVRAVGDEMVLLNLASETYFGLDPVATRMWQLLIECDSIESARDALLAEYEVASDALQRDLDAFIGELVAQNLVSVAPRG